MRRRLASLAAVALLAASCGARRSATAVPEIHYGEEECSTCRMIVSEERHASAWVTATGEVERFDDLRCLLGYLEGHAQEPGEIWVHGEDLAWIAAGDAWFARSRRTITPMGSGLAAFASREEAESFGTVMSWGELRAESLAGAESPSEIQSKEESS